MLTMLPGCLRARQRCAAACIMYQVPLRFGVDDRVPALDREVDRGLRKLAAGAVDEMIEAALRGPQRIEQRGDGIRVPDVRALRGRLQATMTEMIDQRIELVGIAA